ncbi:serpin-zx [Phtheirospermum japonicum]|uniref:Serpin-zx n=1 Tax=Phtheirospermum japonicum TaxID=374723 RepID=A0A830C9M4_9LAMI|nr:serpin-zx [Phtheirospermum japonicum]
MIAIGLMSMGLLSPTYAFGIQSVNTLTGKIKVPSSPRCFNPNLGKKYAPTYPRVRAVATAIDLRKPIIKQTDFSLSFAKHAISTEAKDTNFVISPLSVHIGLGMITAGSEGPTRDQLLDYLQSESVAELNSLSSKLATRFFADGLPLGGPNLSFANGIWVDRSLPLKPDFKGFFKDDFKVAVKDVDFQTKANKVREEVNEWAYRKTEGLIIELIPSGSVNFRTRLLLANALYFRGLWDEDQFDKSVTRNRNFFLSNGKSVQVPFMSSWENQYVRAFDDFKVATLPYKQGADNRKFSMHIFLPDAKDGLPLPALLEKICSNSGFIQHHLPYERVKVGNFRIPKFKVRTGIEASGVLKGHGLDLPFSSGGLTKMVDDSAAASKDHLCVSLFFHESFIEVDELGSRAAVPSALPPGFGSTPYSEWLDFVADHPFLFVIREDKSGVLLFVGQVHNPLAA